MSRETKNTLLLQGSILAAAGIFTKLIGFLYRIPMANLLGNQGNGVYSVAYGIYTITLTLSSMSLPTAVSKVVSARLAREEGRNASRVLAMALLFALVMGTFSFSLLYFGADMLEELYSTAGLHRPLQVLAPTSFVFAFLGVMRGYTQGSGDMVPTAVFRIRRSVLPCHHEHCGGLGAAADVRRDGPGWPPGAPWAARWERWPAR